MFRKMRGIRLKEDQQGYLFFLCRTYQDQPKETQEKINGICCKVSSEPAYCKALFDVLTTKKSIVEISMQYCVGQTTLYNLRRKFYETWYKEEAGN